MPPKKGVTTRRQSKRGGSTSDSTPEFSQLFAEQLAASMPDILSQINASILQTLGSSGQGGGTGPRGGSGQRGGTRDDSGAGGGSGTTVIEDDPRKSRAHKAFMGCKPPEFRGTEGAVGTLQWMEKIESIFHVIGCPEADRVDFGTFMFHGTALTWWNTILRT